MSCADVRERIFDHLYGLLEDEERSAVEKHLRNCPACGAERAKAGEQRTLLRVEPAAAVPPGLAERALRRVAPPRRFPLRALAAAAGVLLAAGLLWTASRERGLVWDSGGVRRTPAEGERLSSEGLLSYPDGSRISLRPGARLQARGRRAALLEAGEIRCRVAPSDERFVVSTPAAELVVLGTEFTVSLKGDEEMDRSKAIGSGLLLTVAVAGGVVLVSNGAGEVTLRAEEAAAVRPGEAPARIGEAEERKVSDQAREVAAEADALRTEAEELRRAGRLLLAERQRRAGAPEPEPAARTAKKELSDLMRAQMKVMLKSKVKEQVDELDKKLALTPEQRRAAEALYERRFEKILDALAGGDFGAFDDDGLEKEFHEGVSRLLRPDQRQLYEKAREEEAEAARLRQEAEARRAFGEAADAMGLAEAERSALEPLLAAPLRRFREEDAKLQVKAFTGGLSLEALRAAQAALRSKLLEELKDRVAPGPLDALRLHLEKLSISDDLPDGK